MDRLCAADPEYDLGITGTMKIAHLAASLRLGCRDPCAPARRIDIAWPDPQHQFTTSSRWWGREVRQRPAAVYADGYADQLKGVDGDGCFPVPQGPGLGVTYDWGFIEKHRTALHEFK
jgi:L-alanine-DL-glutamate epimerase-like enolase superfamily enzyme